MFNVEMGTIHKFEDLEVWKLAREITVEIQNLSNIDKIKKDYRLYDQIDGSSGSAMDNIAEGFERNGNKEFHQFLSISKASIGETRSQLYRIKDRGYSNDDEHQSLIEKCNLLSRKLSSLMKYLRETDLKGTKFKR